MEPDATETANALVDLLFEKAGVGLCLVGPDGAVVRANGEWLRSTGFALDEVLGADVLELFPDTRDLAAAMHARARAGHHVEVPRHAQRVQGRETWWEGSIDPVPLQGATGLLLTAREVTGEAPRAGRRGVERQRELAERSPRAVLLNVGGRIVFANRAAQELFGAAGDALVGKTPFELFHPECHEEIRARVAALEAGGRHPDVVEQRIVRLDGTPRDVEVAATPFDDEGARGIEVVLRDVTDRRQAERRHAIIAGIARIFENALTTGTEEELGRACLAIAEEVTGSRFGFLGEVNRGTGRLDDIAISDPGWDACRIPERTGHGQRKVPIAFEIHGLYGRVLLDGKSLLSNDPRAHPDSIGTPPGHPPLRAFLGVPLSHAGETWGMLAVGNREGGYGPDELAAAEALAPAIVQAFMRKRAEEALRRANEKLRATLDSIMDGLLVLDRAWRFTHVSERAAEIIGLRREALLGERVWDVFPHARGTLFHEGYHRAVETGKPVHFEEYYPAPFGLWLECHCQPSAEGLTVYFRDVSDRRRAEEALRASEDRARLRAAELEALVEAVPAAVFVARDPQARQVEGNALAFAALRLARGANLSRTAPLGESPTNFRALRRGEEIPAEDLPMQRAARGEEVRGGEFDLAFDDGEVRCLYGNATPLRDAAGRSCGAVGAFIDVTALRHAEQGLREANEELRGADRRKDEFLAMLSHELRNPLAPIRNSVYILRHAKPGGEQALRAQAVIERQAEHLTRLVDDLLDVTRIARGKIVLSRAQIDLRELLWRAADDFRLAADERGLVFRAALPSGKIRADADATRVAQLVGNLLNNAAKFTRRGDEVTLSLEVVAGAAEIRVRDTGVGIDPGLLPHVFEPFVQGERTLARTEGGLGLGLALVKGIAELHGGTVRAESAGSGSGAEIVVRLPLRPAGAAQESPRAAVRPRSGGRRVLVVDDNPDAARSLAEIVELLGHAAEIAYDGPSALEKARAGSPGVVLCDIGLPGMSGYEVARALRASAGDRVQLFAVSGYAQPDDVRKAVEAGFDGHVAKPVDPAELERLLS